MEVSDEGVSDVGVLFLSNTWNRDICGVCYWVYEGKAVTWEIVGCITVVIVIIGSTVIGMYSHDRVSQNRNRKPPSRRK